ncbi:MAG: hypothetical protein LBL62_05100 [Planctomycetaceae bacterium]|nr:hypothetical protein [Planctomycetaceae bacterium]
MNQINTGNSCCQPFRKSDCQPESYCVRIVLGIFQVTIFRIDPKYRIAR